MPGPTPGFLANMGAAWDAFAPGAELAGYGTPSPTPVMSGLPGAPPPPMLNTSAAGAPPINMGPPPAGPPTPPPGMSSPFEDPNGLVSRAPPAMSQGPAPVPVGVEPQRAPPPRPPMPDDVQFMPAKGPGRPAREVPTRGAHQTQFLESSYGPPVEAANQIKLRSGDQAQHESEIYDRMAEEAQARQAAMEQAAARRQQEMAQMRASYDQTIQQLGDAKLDHNRLWANSSTLDKIAATALIHIAGLTSGLTNGLIGGRIVRDIDKRLKDDVDAQKFDYEKGLNLARAKQTAFGMAMQQYGNEDAAYNAATAAAHQAVAAKVGSMQAQWKGTDAANQADMLIAGQLQKANESRSAGYAFLQPQPGVIGYQMSIRGQRIPGLVPLAKAQEYAVTHGVAPAERVDEKLVQGGIDSSLQGQKLAAEQAKQVQQHAVVMPNGETVNAPSEAEAKDLRKLVDSTTNTQRLVNEALKIRNDSAFRVSPSSRARLGQIQSELLTDFGVQHSLGALSDKDYEIAQSGTADLFNVGSPVEARLHRLNESVTSKLQAHVRTLPGAPAKSAGVVPKSFQEGLK